MLHNGTLKSLPNSSRKPRKVRAKQMHQMNMHQLITPSFRASLLDSNTGTRREISCPTRRRRVVMVLQSRPENKLIVLLMVRQVTGSGVVCNLACFPPKVL